MVNHSQMIKVEGLGETMKKSKRNGFFKKYINGTKGVISLFLAALMVPFATIAGALINAGRVNSAVAIFDEALCNASNSALGTYDDFIRKRFGLMAMSQDTSDGGSRFGYAQGNYTADMFVNDLFSYYIEKNLESLSNTYDSVELEAIGVYPLSDPAILKNAVTQSQTFPVMAKFVTDWGSLDDMIAKLTKNFKLLSSVESLLTSGSGVVASIDALGDKQEAFEKAITDFNDAKKKYTDAYNDFIKEVKSFNTLVDNIDSTMQAIENYKQQIADYSAEEIRASEQVAVQESEVNRLRQSGAEAEAIAEAEATLSDLRDYKSTVSSNLRTASNDLARAESNLASYKAEFPGKRNAVIQKQSNYEEKILALRDEVNTISSAATGFQNAIKKVVDDGVGLVKNMASTGIEIANNGIEDQIENLSEEDEYYKYQKQLADYEGRTEEATYYYNMLQENASTKNNLNNNKINNQNANKLAGAAETSLKAITTEISGFAERDLIGEYRTIYDELEKLRVTVNGISVPSGYSRMSSYDYYYEFENPVEKADLKTIVENLEKTIAESAGWAVLKAMVGFVDALLNIEVTYNSQLKSNIKTSLYTSIGGLPSQKSYPIVSKYDHEDAALSMEYKDILNSYSSEAVYYTESNYTSVFERMVAHVYALKGYLSNFTLKNLSKMWNEAKGLISCIGEIAKFVKTSLDDAASNKLQMIAYIAYNTANRTTYGGKALTGASYALPPGNANDGYAFSGAETEYIIIGSRSEQENQERVFALVYAQRLLFNIWPVMSDATIQTLATSVGAATFGIGAVVTYVVAILLEGLVDAIILVNGEEIPIAKTFAYITPTGIPKLLEKILALGLNEKTKKQIYEGASQCAYDMNEGIKDFALESKYGQYVETEVNLPSYPDYSSEQAKESKKFTNIFTFNYTKCLQINMLLLVSTDQMTRRLADIIQMEASYNAKKKTATYDFNLDKSYTYLRASGNFKSGLFMKIGDDESVSSQKRVIYNGY